MTGWLDQNCGADGWAMTPSGMRGVINDALSIYFLDVTPRKRLCGPMVRRLQGRDRGGRLQGQAG
jgi:hypothetical protein